MPVGSLEHGCAGSNLLKVLNIFIILCHNCLDEAQKPFRKSHHKSGRTCKMIDKKLHTEDVESLLDVCLNKIENTDTDFGDKLSLNSVVNSYRDLLSNHTVNRELLSNIEQSIDSRYGRCLRSLYHQALIYQLYLDNYAQIDNQYLPEGVSNYLKEDFLRIVDYAKKENPKFLTFNDFQFFSYMQKLCFKCFPVGNHNVNISGFSRSLVFRQTFYSKLTFIKTVLGMGGNYPLFELHYNPHRLRLFNPDGWNEVFSLSAQILKVKKEVKGVFGATWFYDPAIERISPELYYIRKLIEKIGGEFFLVGSSEDDKKNAFFASNARKKSYEEGKYVPTSYMAIIKRDSLLRYYM